MRRAASARVYRVTLDISGMTSAAFEAWSAGECSSSRVTPRGAADGIETWDVLAAGGVSARAISQREIDIFASAGRISVPRIIAVELIDGAPALGE